MVMPLKITQDHRCSNPLFFSFLGGRRVGCAGRSRGASFNAWFLSVLSTTTSPQSFAPELWAPLPPPSQIGGGSIGGAGSVTVHNGSQASSDGLSDGLRNCASTSRH